MRSVDWPAVPAGHAILPGVQLWRQVAEKLHAYTRRYEGGS